MPTYPFTQLKREIRSMYAEQGHRASSRELHALAQGIMLTEYAEQFASASEAYFRDVSDMTGEEAVQHVLIEYLSRYGALKAPSIQAVAA